MPRLSYSSRASQTHGTKTGIRIASFLLREMGFSLTEIAAIPIIQTWILACLTRCLWKLFGLGRWNSYVSDRVITT